MTATRLKPGDTIDSFTVESVVPAGAMARVYRVSHPARRQFGMVLKQPRLGGDDAEFLLGFETELAILPALTGPHAPRFVTAGDLERAPYLVMEWVDGQPLAQELQRAPLPADEVAWFGALVADALHDLHRQDVIHLDLKPDNIVIRHSGIATLLDFGLAHHARFPDLHLEEQRFAAGSAPYVSPEQVLGVRGDARSDLFALGVVLYELATARLPFGVPRSMAGMRDRLWRMPIPPCVRVPSVPPWLQEIILRCLEPDPAARYPSAAQLAFALRHPESVAISQRGWRRTGPGLAEQAGRWWRARHIQPARKRLPNLLSGEAPIIMVALDAGNPDDPRHEALQRNAKLIFSAGDFRLVLVSVIPVDLERSESAQLRHRVWMRHWCDPLGLARNKISLHVLEAADPANALLDFARTNLVDLIVLGAPGPHEAPLGWWRSVASSVTALAHCSVHVVRVPTESRG